MTCAAPAETRPVPLVRNYALLTAGEFASKLLGFAAFTWMGRTLGPERYGAVEFTLAAMIFFTLPVDLGLGDYGAREVARERQSAASLVMEIGGLRLLLALGSFLLLLLFTAALNKSADVKALLVLYGISLFGIPALLQWFFQAHDQMHFVALASLARHSVFAGLVIVLVGAGAPLVRIGWIECVSVAAAALVCLLLLRPRFRLPGRGAARRLWRHLREAAPIGLSQLAWAFQWYFATVLLGLLTPDRSLGWFGAAHRILMALHTFVWLYFFNLLPSMSRSASLPRRHLRELLDRSMPIAAWGSTLVALLVSLLARPIITTAYGAAYAGSADVLAVLAWMLPVSMISGHYRYTLLACDRQRALFVLVAVSAAVAIAFCLVLIPMFGAVGAAVGLLLGNVANLALVYVHVRRQFGVTALWKSLDPRRGLAL
jgi:O-antigen/teichoic acid export membrane protein